VFKVFYRTIALYLVLIIGLRITGKRQIGQLEPIELVLTLLISDLASVPMQDLEQPLINGIIPIATLLSLSTLLSFLSMRFIRFRRFICGEPNVIIADGKLRQDVLRRNRMTPDEIEEQLRTQGISHWSDVKYAILETSGHISVLLYAAQQPLTASQLQIPVQEDVYLSRIIVSDGRLLTENLKRAGLNDIWLQKQLAKEHIRSVKDVFLLTANPAGEVVLIKKDKKKRG